MVKFLKHILQTFFQIMKTVDKCRDCDTFQASLTPGFVTELAGLRLKTETFSGGAPLVELLGQGGPRELFCGGEGSNNTKVGKTNYP